MQSTWDEAVGEVLKKAMGLAVPWLLHMRFEAIAGVELSDGLFSEIWELTTRFVDRDREALRTKLRGCEEIFLIRRDGALVYYWGWRPLLGEEGGPWVAFTVPFACGSPAARGHAFGTTFTIVVVLRLLTRYPRRDLYATMACSTSPGYVHIARGAARYWPRPGVPVPPRIQVIAAALARVEGYTDIDIDALLARRHGLRPIYKDCLNSKLGTSTDRHVRDYLALNPGQENGDTLLVVASWDLGVIPRLSLLPLRGLRRSLAAWTSRRPAPPGVQG